MVFAHTSINFIVSHSFKAMYVVVEYFIIQNNNTTGKTEEYDIGILKTIERVIKSGLNMHVMWVAFNQIYRSNQFYYTST